jgi:preprotein translocase subunit SecD
VPLLIVVVGALALFIDFWPGPKGLGDGARFVVLNNVDGGFAQPLHTALGLDLSGGYSVTYQAQPITKDGKTTYPDAGAMETIRGIIEKRVNGSGLTESVVQTQGTDQVLVSVPNAKNPTEIQDLVGQSGLLLFIPLDRTTYGYMNTSTGTPVQGTKPIPAVGDDVTSFEDQALFGGDQVDAGQTNKSYDTTNNKWAVNLVLKDTAAKKFSTWTTANVGSYFMIVMSDRVVETPFINEAITTGKAQISGSFTPTSAQALVDVIRYGALPFRLERIQDSYIPASLGKTFLNQTLLAGGIGILLVMLFMLIYYRLPGIVACLALVYYSVAVLAFFRILPVTLSLAGIAAFVLSIGMAVDANILIFERTKEELRTGKTLITALEAGFNRAWNSIFDSNVSSLITASILYFLGSPTVKGFALVLIIGVATSLFSAITVSRTLLRFIVKQSFATKAWMYGVTDEEFQARALPGRYRREARSRV